MQDRLRPLVVTTGPGPADVRRVAGLDVAYAEDSDRLAAAVVVLDPDTLQVLERSVVLGHARFPYVPGLFAFRELPSLVEALDGLSVPPDLLVCDGQGLAHPRRFGLACHLGVHTGIPSIGVGKTAFVGTYDTPPPHRGAASDLVLDGDVVGAVLRTQDNVKPVFVSVGHGLDLAAACRHVLALSPHFRLPETTRQADTACRAALAQATAAGLARDAVRSD
ncbi:endonuclease V [Yinghuangia soli]|uniref:Endonuclease V n=1 Tax=Yinghuangia soli TaxID=2908204 RepID=A0AA41Q7N1_9ACTN|nr:endonuclease V [Yinghuangia soli]MCF2531849.1 endonuclease V [Yinghuangia soli]